MRGANDSPMSVRDYRGPICPLLGACSGLVRVRGEALASFLLIKRS